MNKEFEIKINMFEPDTSKKNENLNKNTLCLTGGADVNLGNIVLSGRLGWDMISNKGDGTSYNSDYASNERNLNSQNIPPKFNGLCGQRYCFRCYQLVKSVLFKMHNGRNYV